MNLPAKAERIEFKNLQQWLPSHVVASLEHELSDVRWTPEQLKDEPTLRYVFMSVLEHWGLDCPHPWRRPLPGYALAFECPMCRSWIFPNEA